MRGRRDAGGVHPLELHPLITPSGISGDPERRTSMADTRIQFLLERAVDSRTKLYILLIFHESPHLEATPTVIVERCCRDIWSVRQALKELVEDGILAVSRSVGGEPFYCFQPCSEYVQPIEALIRSYDDPYEREALLHAISDLSGYAVIRHASGQRFQAMVG
jgi:hypothetical protein